MHGKKNSESFLNIYGKTNTDIDNIRKSEFKTERSFYNFKFLKY
jgi:hypothetical protein